MRMEAAQIKIVLNIRAATRQPVQQLRKKRDAMAMEILQYLLAGASPLLSGILLFEYRKRANADAQNRAAQEQKHEALVQGVVAMLRDRLIDTMDHHIEAGWVPVHKAEAIHRMYMSYHNLGGNDIVTKTYQRFILLPHHQGDD